MSAGAVKRSNDEIISEAKGHNRGDVALGHAPNLTRESVINKEGLKMNIMPGDIINKDRPTDNYQFTWCDFNDPDYFQDCKDDGYKVVIEPEWVNARWEWSTPDKDKFRWNESRMLVHRSFFLMYRNETLYRQQVAKRLQLAEDQIASIYDKGIEAGLAHGMSVEGEYAGNPINVSAPKRRHTVS